VINKNENKSTVIYMATLKPLTMWMDEWPVQPTGIEPNCSSRWTRGRHHHVPIPSDRLNRDSPEWLYVSREMMRTPPQSRTAGPRERIRNTTTTVLFRTHVPLHRKKI